MKDQGESRCNFRVYPLVYLLTKSFKWGRSSVKQTLSNAVLLKLSRLALYAFIPHVHCARACLPEIKSLLYYCHFPFKRALNKTQFVLIRTQVFSIRNRRIG